LFACLVCVWYELNIYSVYVLVEGEFSLSKKDFIRYVLRKPSPVMLRIKHRKQGSRIESVPMKDLIWLSFFPVRSWEYKDGLLILTASEEEWKMPKKKRKVS